MTKGGVGAVIHGSRSLCICLEMKQVFASTGVPAAEL
jgi:hypothetical protein